MPVCVSFFSFVLCFFNHTHFSLPLYYLLSITAAARFEMWMLAAFKFMDCDLEIIAGPRGRTYHADELCEVIDSQFVRALFSFGRSMQELDLSKQDIAVLQGIALTFAGW